MIRMFLLGHRRYDSCLQRHCPFPFFLFRTFQATVDGLNGIARVSRASWFPFFFYFLHRRSRYETRIRSFGAFEKKRVFNVSSRSLFAFSSSASVSPDKRRPRYERTRLSGSLHDEKRDRSAGWPTDRIAR